MSQHDRSTKNLREKRADKRLSKTGAGRRLQVRRAASEAALNSYIIVYHPMTSILIILV